MDAREYLNRKGVGLDKEPDKPNTLEEKAWERARGAGHHGPKSGTPFDWEEWETYHSDLAADAETLEQKIDKDAHRNALNKPSHPQADTAEHTDTEQTTGQGSVGYFEPPGAGSSSQPSAAQSSHLQADDARVSQEPLPVQAMSVSLKTAFLALAILLPPLAVWLSGGQAKRVGVACLLTALLWIPGVVYAARWVFSR